MTVQEFEMLAKQFGVMIFNEAQESIVLCEGAEATLIALESDSESIEYLNRENADFALMPIEFIGYAPEEHVAYYLLYTNSQKRIVADEKYRMIR